MLAELGPATAAVSTTEQTAGDQQVTPSRGDGGEVKGPAVSSDNDGGGARQESATENDGKEKESDGAERNIASGSMEAGDDFVVVDGSDAAMAKPAVMGGERVPAAVEEKKGEGPVLMSTGGGGNERVQILSEGRYETGVLIALDPARPGVLKLTIGHGGNREAGGVEGLTVFFLRTEDR